MPRLKLLIAYDGFPWKGWQSQRRDDTIQDQMEAALVKIVGKRVVVHGSGRTDTGVHARGQVAHIEVPEPCMNVEGWMRALNGNLPRSIRVLNVEPAAADFHARFDAIGKIYEYRIWNAAVMSPFEVGRAWHLHGPLDVDSIREGAAILRGKHNFARLSANRGGMTEIERREDEYNLTRTIHRIDLFQEDELLRLEFQGEGFLYKMVRMLTGSMLQVARGRATMDWLRDLVEDPDGEKSHHCAPADGLFLMKVFYPEAGESAPSDRKSSLLD